MKTVLLLLCLFTTSIFAQTTKQTVDKAVTEITKSSATIVDKTTNGVDKVYTDGTKGIDRIYTDGTKVIEKAYSVAETIAPKIEEALKSLGSSLQVSANQLWDILVKQQKVWSICYLLVTLLALLSWGHFLYRFKIGSTYLIESGNNKGEWKEANLVITLLTCCISCALSITSYLHFTTMLTGFINPEYGALNTIIEIASEIKIPTVK